MNVKKNQNKVCSVQTNDYNTYKKFVAKRGSWREKYDLYSNEQVTPMVINRVSERLIAWVEASDSLSIEEFLGAECIPYNSWIKWCKRFDHLGELYANVKMVLAGRREKGALKGDLNAGMVVYSHRLYSPFWAELAADHAAKKESSANAGTITVVLDSIPASVMVPEKKGSE